MRIGRCSVSKPINTRRLDYQERPQQEMVDSASVFYQQMRRRRSVREFADRPVPMQVIFDAIAAAGTAPSGANKQPWHFALTTDSLVKAQLRVAAEFAEREFYQRRATDAWLDAGTLRYRRQQTIPAGCAGTDWRIHAENLRRFQWPAA